MEVVRGGVSLRSAAAMLNAAILDLQPVIPGIQIEKLLVDKNKISR